MKYIFCGLLLATICSSCFLFSPYTSSSYSYQRDGRTVTFPLVVPKGYVSSVVENDSTGQPVKRFKYPGGAELYVANVDEKGEDYQRIYDSINIPLYHRLGGLVYKGVNPDFTFWREIQRKNIRIGYINVSRSREGEFDSATNFISLQQLQ